MTMREQIARAMWERNRQTAYGYEVQLLPWDEENEQLHADWLALAEAALTAMREPTAEMRLVGGYTQKYGETEDERYAYGIWQAMIDAALKEE